MNILITGGTGSFGQAMTRYMIPQGHVDRVAVFSRDELKQHEMRMAIEAEYEARTLKTGIEKVRYLLGDVRDLSRLEHAFRGVDVVIHAAALKHVHSGEYNPREVVRTNVEGAQNVIEAAIRAGVKQVIAISTDKAVNPANLYGATKMTAERLFLTASTYAGGTLGSPSFVVIRYGNVAGSRGSIIPLWREQIRRGQPLTITDPAMTRFWYTLKDATRLVEAVARDAWLHGKRLDAKVLVPRMQWYKVGDLALALTREEVSYQQKIIGIRPGEKMHEALIGPEESRYAHKVGNLLWHIESHPISPPYFGAYISGKDPDDRLTVDELVALLRDIP